MSHEIVEQFARRGLRLRRTLEEMLDEHPSHRTERRGCGFTQATRFLAAYVNEPGLPGDATDLETLEDWPARETACAALSLLAAHWPYGWRRVDELPSDLREMAAQYSELIDMLAALRQQIVDVATSVALPESRLFLGLFLQVIRRDGSAYNCLPPMPVKPQIGSCSQAEEFFLELAHGRVRRAGSVNVFVDESFRPLLVEKMNLGESHSAMVLEPVRLNGVDLPPGALCALAHSDDAKGWATAHGRGFPIRAIGQARFLRLTTLAVDPCDRHRAFSSQLEAELRGGMLSPATTTLDELRAFAASEAKVGT